MKRKKNYKVNSPFRPNQVKQKKPNLSESQNLEDTKPLVHVEYDLESFSRSLNGASPRLLVAAKEFSVGKDTLVEFLISKGFVLSNSPSSKLSFEMYVELIKEYTPLRLKDFELEVEPLDFTVIESNISLSYAEGRFILRQQTPEGSVVIANGLETRGGIFFPFFSSTTDALRELEDLINDPDVSEDDLQKFLEHHRELILDEEYEYAIPQARIITEERSWEADFVLVPFAQNEFSKIVELKLPQEKVPKADKNGHQGFTAKLYSALRQIKDYYNAFDDTSTRRIFREKYGMEVYKPDLQLIIGRKGDFQMKQTHLTIQREQSIKITDWDTFLEKQKRKFTTNLRSL